MVTLVRRSCCAMFLLLAPALTQGADYRVEPLAAAPPTNSIAPSIAGLLNAEGFKVLRGQSRTVCEIWLAKQWDTAEGELPAAVNYPLKPGSLVGVVRFPKKAGDFRDQDIAEGIYTLRYAQQPVDGAHVGTSPTRDFLLLLPADKDTNAGVLDYATMVKSSAEAAGSNHPLLLSLQKAADGGEALGMRHAEDLDWWIVRFTGKTKAKDVAVELVISGHAEA